jgi:hypothetical protein
MVRFTTDEGKVTCVAEIGDRVGVYLDNDVVSELARPGALRDRFINAMRRRGTLLFSFANAIEVSISDNVRSFLDDLGPEWIPLALSPWEVVKREKAGDGPSSPVSERFVTSFFQERAYQLSPNGKNLLDLSSATFFRLSAVVDWVRKDPAAIRDCGQIDQALLDRIAQERTDYESCAAALDKSLPPVAFNVSRPAMFALFHLLRTLVVEARAYQLRPHDGLDLCHAVLAASYAQIATLDKQWKRRVEGLPRPHQLATVYYRAEADAFVHRVEELVDRCAP